MAKWCKTWDCFRKRPMETIADDGLGFICTGAYFEIDYKDCIPVEKNS